MSVNRATILGRLGADPEIRTAPSGRSVGTLRIVTNTQWTDSAGRKQKAAEWHRVVVWGSLADVAGRYLSRGREVYIEGRIQTRPWQDQRSAEKRYTTEIIATNLQLLGAKPDEATSADGEQAETAVPCDPEHPSEQLEQEGWKVAGNPQGGPGQPLQGP